MQPLKAWVFLSLLFCCTSFFPSRSQTRMFSGIIYSKYDTIPIPFASIKLRKSAIETFSNSRGIFNVSFQSLTIPDTLIIEASGYKKLAVRISNQNQSGAYYLEPIIHHLNEVTVEGAISPYEIVSAAFKQFAEKKINAYTADIDYYEKISHKERQQKRVLQAKGAIYMNCFDFNKSLLQGAKPTVRISQIFLYKDFDKDINTPKITNGFFYLTHLNSFPLDPNTPLKKLKRQYHISIDSISSYYKIRAIPKNSSSGIAYYFYINPLNYTILRSLEIHFGQQPFIAVPSKNGAVSISSFQIIHDYYYETDKVFLSQASYVWQQKGHFGEIEIVQRISMENIDQINYLRLSKEKSINIYDSFYEIYKKEYAGK